MNYIYFLLIACLAPTLVQARILKVINRSPLPVRVSFTLHAYIRTIQPGQDFSFSTWVCDPFGEMIVKVETAKDTWQEKNRTLVNLDKNYAEITASGDKEKIYANLSWNDKIGGACVGPAL